MKRPPQITFRHMRSAKRRGRVKRRVDPEHGFIHELDSKRGIGRIDTNDGRLVYFHRRSIVGSRFQDLTTGTEVRFAEETGARGAQASTVHVIS